MAGEITDLMPEDVNLIEAEVGELSGKPVTDSQMASTAAPDHIIRNLLSAAAGEALAPGSVDGVGRPAGSPDGTEGPNAVAVSATTTETSLADLLAGPDLDIATAAGKEAPGLPGAGAPNGGGVFEQFDPLSGIGGFSAIGGLNATALGYGQISRESHVDEAGNENGHGAGSGIGGSGIGGSDFGSSGGNGATGGIGGGPGGNGGSGGSSDGGFGGGQGGSSIGGGAGGSGGGFSFGGSGDAGGGLGGSGGNHGPAGLPSHQDNGHGNNAGQTDSSNPGQGGGNHGAFTGLTESALQSLYSHRVDGAAPLGNTVHYENDGHSTAVHLSPKDVLNFADGSNELFVTGDANDTVFLTGNWTFTNSNVLAPDGHHYDVFQSTAGGQPVTVFVDLNMSMPGIESNTLVTAIL